MSNSIRRAVAGFAAVTAVIVAVLLGLGVWQLERRQEKRDLIAALTERLAAAPVPLPPVENWARLSPEHDEFRRVTFQAARDGRPAAAVFTSGSSLRPDVTGIGTWDFAPVRTTSGHSVVVDFGFVPDGQTAPSPAGAAPLTLIGYLRFPEHATWFTPAPDVARRTWYARTPSAMAQALGWGEVAPFYIDLEAPAGPGPWPKPGPLDVHLRDQHLQYAITWFGLAAAVVVAFGVWLSAQRRRG